MRENLARTRPESTPRRLLSATWYRVMASLLLLFPKSRTPLCAKKGRGSLFKQEHMVSILNRLAALCNHLTNGLSAESDTSKKQFLYAFSRDKLLTIKVLDA